MVLFSKSGIEAQTDGRVKPVMLPPARLFEDLSPSEDPFVVLLFGAEPHKGKVITNSAFLARLLELNLRTTKPPLLVNIEHNPHLTADHACTTFAPGP